MTFAFMGMTRSPSTEREGRIEADLDSTRSTSQYIRDNRATILKILNMPPVHMAIDSGSTESLCGLLDRVINVLKGRTKRFLTANGRISTNLTGDLPIFGVRKEDGKLYIILLRVNVLEKAPTLISVRHMIKMGFDNPDKF